MALPWIVVKVALTAGVLSLIGGGSYAITSQHPPSLALQTFIEKQVQGEPVCNRSACSDHGECDVQTDSNSSFVCACDDLYYGPLCELSCPQLCSGVGSCKATNDTTNLTFVLHDHEGNVTCNCPRTSAGPLCEVSCPQNCSFHGECTLDGTCQCDLGFGGDGCEVQCGGNCSNGWCAVPGICKCVNGYYGNNCDIPTQPCYPIADLVVSGPGKRIDETFVFPEGCDVRESSYSVNIVFEKNTSICVSTVVVSKAQFAKLSSASQDDSALVVSFGDNVTLGLLQFANNAAYLSFRPLYSAGAEQSFGLSAYCSNTLIQPNSVESCPKERECDYEVTYNPDTGAASITASLYDDPYALQVDVPHLPSVRPSDLFSGSWVPQTPHLNVLTSSAYTRPDVLTMTASSQFAVGLGWFTIVVAVLCCCTFLVMCVRSPQLKETVLTPVDFQGKFSKVLLREMKQRHAIVSMFVDSPLWTVHAKFMMLFLNTFVNLALSALWFGQRSAGEMISSTLITALSVFVLMQLMRICLKGSHLSNKWYIPVVSYTAPLALAVWSAYTSGLYILSMGEEEAHYFLIRAVCSFVLQHTIFFSVTTTFLVLVQRCRENRKNQINANQNPINALPL